MSQSNQLTQLPAVARNIHLPCKKCNCDRYFVVVAHTSSTTAKVKCEVCSSTKTFKLAKPAAKKTTTRLSSGGSSAKKGTRGVTISAEDAWADLKNKIGVDGLVPYSMKVRFEVSTAIDHPKFGVGFVTGVTAEKIEVAFQEGGRSLVHNRT